MAQGSWVAGGQDFAGFERVEAGVLLPRPVPSPAALAATASWWRWRGWRPGPGMVLVSSASHTFNHRNATAMTTAKPTRIVIAIAMRFAAGDAAGGGVAP